MEKKIFSYVWWPKIDEIVGKQQVFSPKFSSSLNNSEVRFTWQLHLLPICNENSQKCQIFLRLIETFGVENKSVLAGSSFKLFTNDGKFGFDSDRYENFEEYKVDGDIGFGENAFAPEMFTRIPDNVAVFHENRVKILCKMYIYESVFRTNVPSSPAVIEEKQIDGEDLDVFSSVARNLYDDYVSKGELNSFSDLTITATDGKQFHCHNFVLCSQSSVDKKALYLDIESERLEKILAFMYERNPVDLSPDLVMKCLDYAERFNMLNTKIKCDLFLRNSLDVDNVLDIIAVAEKCQSRILLDNALHFVARNFENMQNEEKWSSFARNHSRLVLLVLKAFYGEIPVNCSPLD